MALSSEKILAVIKQASGDKVSEAKPVAAKVDWAGRLVKLRQRRNPEADPTEEPLSHHAEATARGEDPKDATKSAVHARVAYSAREGTCPHCKATEHEKTSFKEDGQIICGVCHKSSPYTEWGVSKATKSAGLFTEAELRERVKQEYIKKTGNQNPTPQELLAYAEGELLERTANNPKVAAAVRPKMVSSYDIDEGDDVPVDIPMLLSATRKLLDVNKGVTEPDERDSLSFRRVYTPDKLLAERIALDAGKVRRSTMRRVAKYRNLKPVGTAPFDGYAQGLLVGNPLSSPLEEINPLHLVEQQRRITQLGPGGLDPSSITEQVQALHPSVFGFLDAIAGPESEKIGVDTRAAWGTKIGSDGRIYQRFKNRRTGQHEWLSPADLANHVVGLPD